MQLLRWVGPAITVFAFVTAYLDRRATLGLAWRQQVARRLIEFSIGIAALLVFGRAADDPSVRAGSPWLRFLLLAPAFYGFALTSTALLHVVHLLFDKPRTPYRLGWTMFWIATVSLVLIVIISALKNN